MQRILALSTSKHRLWLVFLLAINLLSGCSLFPEEIDETKNWSASKLYYSAKESLGEGNFTNAIKLFEKLESRYPYGAYAQQAQLEVAYAYYKDNEPISAVAACERFIKLHPNHPNVDYAYYLRGLANFVEDQTLFARFGDQDLSDRDPKAARDAFDAFQQLSTRFPNSKYSPDAVARMKYLVNSLAASEVHVAHYYYQRGAYVAAANRGKYVLEHYQNAPALEEALALMAKSYDKLGMADLRDDALKVLKRNFPNSAYSIDIPSAGTSPAEHKRWWKFW
ncbi:MAG: outer membrane protein assembly factor BamD [Hydrogenophilales bacterium 28-61-23]|nr:MAG: outer membrane protein assembly factor BamD [Hydrogenophilales bacterium 28-61-23]